MPDQRVRQKKMMDKGKMKASSIVSEQPLSTTMVSTKDVAASMGMSFVCQEGTTGARNPPVLDEQVRKSVDGSQITLRTPQNRHSPSLVSQYQDNHQSLSLRSTAQEPNIEDEHSTPTAPKEVPAEPARSTVSMRPHRQERAQAASQISSMKYCPSNMPPNPPRIPSSLRYPCRIRRRSIDRFIDPFQSLFTKSCSANFPLHPIYPLPASKCPP
jgi:hypothetical protein